MLVFDSAPNGVGALLDIGGYADDALTALPKENPPAPIPVLNTPSALTSDVPSVRAGPLPKKYPVEVIPPPKLNPPAPKLLDPREVATGGFGVENPFAAAAPCKLLGCPNTK